MTLLGSETPEPICSAKGCRVPAVWVLAWNNPKVHTPERRKTWLACAEHRAHLSGFLDMRGFLKDVVTLEEWERPSDTPGSARETAGEGGEGGAADAAPPRPGDDQR